MQSEIAPNRNLLWARVFVEELARCGLKSVCIAPGSRSTPLVMAFAERDDIRIYSHLDERSAAFFALGLALASDEPAAVLCTSGTATANFFPAIIEAYQSQVPLLILTADRAHELRESGANQTIDQVKLYGDQVLWSVDVALPERNPPALVIRSLRTLACRAYAKANGLRKGPVHLNFPFRKPLEPTLVESDNTEIPVEAQARPDGKPFTVIESGAVYSSFQQEWDVLNVIRETPRGIIVCGPRCPGGGFPGEVDTLAYWTQYPIFADPLSGIRFQESLTGKSVKYVSGYDSFLGTASFESPDLVLHFGAMPTSATLEAYLNKITPKRRIWVSENGVWSDANHNVDTFIHTSASSLCSAIVREFMNDVERKNQYPNVDGHWSKLINNHERITWEVIDEDIFTGGYFDGAVLYDIVDLFPIDGTLFVGSSLPVRNLDQFGKPTGYPIHVYANRGASGIDGVVSSALGAGAACPDKPLVMVIGDISLYHDMNGLLAVQRCGIPITIVLLNNDGGGIFHRLPVKDFEPAFTDLFITPHGLDYAHAAKMYGLEYVRADNRETFRQVFSTSVDSDQSHLIEVRTDARRDLQRRKEIMDEVQRRIKP